MSAVNINVGVAESVDSACSASPALVPPLSTPSRPLSTPSGAAVTDAVDIGIERFRDIADVVTSSWPRKQLSERRERNRMREESHC